MTKNRATEKEKRTDIPPDRHKLACRSPALDLDLDGEFTPPETQHYPALPLEKLPELLSR
ncbi:DUF4102 domain-containing protein, partial [Salmonella enterica]|nr:DUF4102 domain-containing protein [Salmonella enterica]